MVELGAGLLMDKSNLVRKTSVQLLEGLLRYNPFGPALPIDLFQLGLGEARDKLKELENEAAGAQKEGSSDKNSVEKETEGENGTEEMPASDDVEEPMVTDSQSDPEKEKTSQVGIR